jgi:hypothetical protein
MTTREWVEGSIIVANKLRRGLISGGRRRGNASDRSVAVLPRRQPNCRHARMRIESLSIPALLRHASASIHLPIVRRCFLMTRTARNPRGNARHQNPGGR